MIKTIKLPERSLMIKVCDMKSYKTCLRSLQGKQKQRDIDCDFIGICCYTNDENDMRYSYKSIICIDVNYIKTKEFILNTIAHEVSHLIERHKSFSICIADEESNANLQGYLVTEIAKIFKVI